MANNSQTQIDTFEYVGSDITAAGFNHPSLGVRQGFLFGWNGSATRSSSLDAAGNHLPGLAVAFSLVEEVLTLAAAATTDTVASLLPTNSIIHFVNGRVITVVPTAANFNVGDATIAARFASGVLVAATTTFVGMLQVDGTGTSGQRQTATAKIRITPNLTPGTATGVVALQVFAETAIPPTA